MQSENRSLPTSRVMAMGALAALVMALLGFRDDITAWPNQTMYVFSTITAVACVIAVGVSSRLQLWSGGFFFITVLALFHFGLPLVFTMGWQVPLRYQQYLLLWLDQEDQVNKAIWLCVVATVTFTLGYLAAISLTTRRLSIEPSRNFQGLAAGGLIITGVGALLYLGFVATTAPELLLGAGGKRLYEQSVAGSEPIAYGTILVSIGSVMAAAAPSSKARTSALSLFAIFTLATLSFGSRTAALYALVTVVVVLARVRPMPRKRVAIAGLLLGLMVVSGVQQVRDDGLSAASITDFVGSPAAAASEMGLVLRPVIETVGWVDNGEPPRLGTTYLTGSIRAIENLAGIERLPSADDPRFAGYLVRSRVDHYQIGYSIVAEAYLNFGYAMAIPFTLLGLGLGRWDNSSYGNSLSAAYYGVVFVALIAHVRQASNITLTTIILGCVAITACHLIAKELKHRTPSTGAARRVA